MSELVVIGSPADTSMRGYKAVSALNWEAAADLAGKEAVVLVSPASWDEEKAGELGRRGVKVVKMEPGWEEELGRLAVWRQSVVSVTGGSGSGRTLVAVLLALAARRAGLSVLVVDLNAGYGGGDLSFYFDLPQVPNWNTFLAGEELEDCLVRAGSFRVLQVPPVPVDIPGDAVERMLRCAREMFDLVVLDLPAGSPGVLSDSFPRSAQYTVRVSGGREDGGENVVVLNDRWGDIRKADVPHIDALAKLETVGGWRGLSGVRGLPDMVDRLMKKIFGGVRRG